VGTDLSVVHCERGALSPVAAGTHLQNEGLRSTTIPRSPPDASWVRELAVIVRGAVLTPAAAVAAILLVTLALHVEWLLRFRHGYLTEWDESGYMQYALSNFDALHDHGFVEFAKLVGGRGTFGPLLPFVTALAYPVVGRGIFGSLLLPPLFFAGLVLATFGLARRIVPARWAVIATLAVATTPLVTDYTRIFHFAVPAAACMTAALWALACSDRLLRARWAIAFGAFVGLALLSRTMIVAFLPGLAIAAGLQLVGAPDRARVRNLGLACVAAAVVAGPWYLYNARSVYDYLANTGYGANAARYGPRHPVLSWAFWTRELHTNVNELWLPLAAVLTLCFLAALLSAVARRSPRRRLRVALASPSLLALIAVVVEAYLALTSSRNQGSAFALPIYPALVVLAAAAAASVTPRGLRLLLCACLVAVSVGALLAKSGYVEPLARVRTVHVVGLGDVSVTDGRGIIQGIVEGAGYDIGSPATPLPKMHRGWLPAERRVTGWSIDYARAHGRLPQLSLGFEDPLFANTRLHLAGQLWFHQNVSVGYLRSAIGDSVASYREQLEKPDRVNVLITGQQRPGATITQKNVVAAARSLGFARLKSFELPDGRRIWAWWRDT